MKKPSFPLSSEAGRLLRAGSALALSAVVLGALVPGEAEAAKKKMAHAHSAGHHGHALHHGAHKGAHAALAGAAAAGAAGGAATVAAKPLPAPPQAQPPAEPTDKGTETGLPLPRYASLRADRVYMRRGPGERYPIDWVYHRRALPMKIEREFGVWRLVEDPDGQKGWVHQVTLRGTRTFVIAGAPTMTGEEKEVAPKPGTSAQHADPRIVAYVPPTSLNGLQNGHDALLMSSPDPDHHVTAALQPGTVGRLRACPADSAWCHVSVKGYDGWVERRLLWGVQPGEIIQPD
ncbi:SH3 domain-containing protein [Oecophyllibacter saccharovorans]|uniref:SH3 domain-containing protein n=1 Tax=Oecophyllibacter saccharovorans TaxID=2558360 RepID=UPI0018A297CA|nr:SH3 domain-containing protein [Oecophyllibacter saccharovorans]